MATNLSFVPFPATAIRPCAAPTSLRTGASRSSPPGSSWWSPIFGWSAEPDYIDSDGKSGNGPEQDESKSARARFAPGCFTAEKAKQLRLMTKETETFHDVMYHSAIASRLALDSKARSGQ